MPWHAFSARSPDAATHRLLHPERSPSPSSHTNIHWYDKRRTAVTPNKKDAAHRHPSPVPFRNVVLWRWFMILANSLFTYTVNISTDIGQYTITSLSGYNRQKCYINTDWKSIIYLYRPYGTWNRCFLGSWVINTDANGMTFSPPGQQQPWYGMRMGICHLSWGHSWHFITISLFQSSIFHEWCSVKPEWKQMHIILTDVCIGVSNRNLPCSTADCRSWAGTKLMLSVSDWFLPGSGTLCCVVRVHLY